MYLDPDELVVLVAVLGRSLMRYRLEESFEFLLREECFVDSTIPICEFRETLREKACLNNARAEIAGGLLARGEAEISCTRRQEMPSLYELTGEYCLLMSALEDGTDTPEELDALLERFRESEAALFEKFEAYARIDRNLRMNEEMARAEARRLQERAQGYAANRERLREHGAFCMEASGLSKANTSVGTLYWHRSESVEVADESQIPPEYIEFVPKIKAAEIKSALKAGVDIPGARLIQRRTLALR